MDYYILILQEEKGLHVSIYWTGGGWSWNPDRAHPYTLDDAIYNQGWLNGICDGVIVSEV